MVASKTFTLDECQKHTKEEDCWLVVHGKVYDVTKFLDEHPGGYDIVLANTGKDATEDFEEIGHSNAAREMLDQYVIGQFAGGDASASNHQAAAAVKQKAAAKPVAAQGGGLGTSILFALLPIALIALIAIYFGVLGGQKS